MGRAASLGVGQSLPGIPEIPGPAGASALPFQGLLLGAVRRQES